MLAIFHHRFLHVPGMSVYANWIQLTIELMKKNTYMGMKMQGLIAQISTCALTVHGRFGLGHQDMGFPLSE